MYYLLRLLEERIEWFTVWYFHIRNFYVQSYKLFRNRKLIVWQPDSRRKEEVHMKFKWLRIVGLMVILSYISSMQVTASEVTNEVQVDEQTRQILMQKYGLEPAEESSAQHDFFSGDWGISFHYGLEMEPLDKLLQIIPFWLWPAVWILRIGV